MDAYETLLDKFTKEASFTGSARRLVRRHGKAGAIGAGSIVGWEVAKQTISDWKQGRRMRRAQENQGYGG